MSDKVLKIIMAVVTVVIIVFDIYLAINPATNTISRIIQTIAFKHPILPFAIGVLCGHWFWPVSKDVNKK